MNEDEVRQALRAVIDPDVGIDIVEMGLIEDIAVGDGRVAVDVIMTTPICPQGEAIRDEAESVLRRAAPAAAVTVRLLTEPMWTPDRLGPAARARLGWG